jgi:hypothetical protein
MVDDPSILLAFTCTRDANFDGLVNDDDVTIMGATYAPGVPQPAWALGDFDYNGFVDDDDVTLRARSMIPLPRHGLRRFHRVLTRSLRCRSSCTVSQIFCRELITAPVSAIPTI